MPAAPRLADRPRKGRKEADMATKSKAAAEKETIEEIKAEEAPVIEEAAAKDSWAEDIDMVVPRKPKGEEQFYYICVNDRRFQVPANGKVQALPKPVAEVLQEMIAAEAEADDYADHIPNKTVPTIAI